MSDVELRPVDPTGPEAQWCIDRFFALLDREFVDGFDAVDDTPEERAEMSRAHGGIFVVASTWTEGEQPVGCGGLRTHAPGVGEIKRMWVHEDLRGTGLGRRILRRLEEYARERGMRRLLLDTNDVLTRAIAFYEAAGYEHVTRYNDNPYARLWFAKDL